MRKSHFNQHASTSSLLPLSLCLSVSLSLSSPSTNKTRQEELLPLPLQKHALCVHRPLPLRALGALPLTRGKSVSRPQTRMLHATNATRHSTTKRVRHSTKACHSTTSPPPRKKKRPISTTHTHTHTHTHAHTHTHTNMQSNAWAFVCFRCALTADVLRLRWFSLDLWPHLL